MATFTRFEELDIYSKNNPEILIVLDFNAVWCSPCKAIKPFIEYLKENYPKVEFYEIDIEDETKLQLVSNFNIIKLPTFIYYKNGKTETTLTGTNKEKIEEMVNEYL